MNRNEIRSETGAKRDDDEDGLFKLPLAEFVSARNELAARLKRDGRADEANLVKALTKPTVSAWAVNQLYWNHRSEFNRLLATSERLRQVQSSQTAERVADMRESLDARRNTLSELSDLAAAILSDAGHNPTPDMLHRITTTLEAISAYAPAADGPTPGRLTHDIDPPGFDSLASLISGTAAPEPNHDRVRLTPSSQVTPSQKRGSAATKTRQGAQPADDVQKSRQAEETRRARIASARDSLQKAKRSLTEARSRAQHVETAQKRAQAEAKETDAKAKQAEKQLREAEERFNKASAASKDAAQRAQRVAAEADDAAQALQDATRSVENASKELESLLKNRDANSGKANE